MADTPLLERIGQFIASCRGGDIPAAARRTAVEALTDYFSVSLPGSKLPVSQNLLSFLAGRTTAGRCVLAGTGMRADPASACLFNGTAAHALDFDDVSWTTIGHPTVSVAPAAVACAQDSGSGGADVVSAYVIGVEAMHQVARWTMPGVSSRGWHTTPAYGPFGAAAAACFIYGLDAGRCSSALAIAASRCSGLRANFGTQAKALHAGLSAAAGVESALMARCGINGNPAAIEAADGFAQCFCGAAGTGSAEFTLGSRWDLVETGLVFKQYPCCSGSHPANDAWDSFLSENSIRAEDIEQIHAGVSLLGPRELSCHLPQDSVQARFSLEYALASRLVFGPLSIGSFTDAKVRDPRVQALMRRIVMEVDPELAALGFIGTAPARLTVRLRNGRVVKLACDLAEGNPEKPLSPAQRRAKLESCLAACGRQGDAQALWDTLCCLDGAGARTVSLLGS